MLLPIDLTTLIIAIIAVVATSLYIKEYFLRKKTLQYQQTISELTKQKSVQLLQAAEKAETQVISEGSYVVKQLTSEFQTQLQKIVRSSEDSIATSQDQLIKFMEDLKKRSTEVEQSSEKLSEQRINELFERLETKLSDFLIETEQKTTSSIELELKATRQLIDTYKTQQLKLIDENILAMMEQTLDIVLGKKLSLKDQLDLVYEALERAKIDKFIV